MKCQHFILEEFLTEDLLQEVGKYAKPSYIYLPAGLHYKGLARENFGVIMGRYDPFNGKFVRASEEAWFGRKPSMEDEAQGEFEIQEADECWTIGDKIFFRLTIVLLKADITEISFWSYDPKNEKMLPIMTGLPPTVSKAFVYKDQLCFYMTIEETSREYFCTIPPDAGNCFDYQRQLLNSEYMCGMGIYGIAVYQNVIYSLIFNEYLAIHSPERGTLEIKRINSTRNTEFYIFQGVGYIIELKDGQKRISSLNLETAEVKELASPACTGYWTCHFVGQTMYLFSGSNEGSHLYRYRNNKFEEIWTPKGISRHPIVVANKIYFLGTGACRYDTNLDRWEYITPINFDCINNMIVA